MTNKKEIDSEAIAEAVNAEQAKYEQLKKAAEKEKRAFDEARSLVYRNMENAVKELEKQIKDIQKPFEENIKELDAEISKKDSEIWKAERMYSTTQERIKASMSKTEFMDGQALKGFLINKGIYVRDVIVKIDKALPNGVSLFRNTDDATGSLGVGYFAVKGKEIIGFALTRKAEHQGDDSEFWGWMNQTSLRGKTQWFNGNKEKDNWGHVVSKTTNFTAWKEAIGKTKKFTSIDLTDKINKTILSEDYRIHYYNLEGKERAD